MECHAVKCKRIHAGDVADPELRASIVEAIDNPQSFVIANYLRSTIGQKTGGHISPVAAYEEESKRVLILDVSRYKYPPLWVKIDDLIDAMNTEDTSAQKKRGIVICRPENVERPQIKK